MASSPPVESWECPMGRSTAKVVPTNKDTLAEKILLDKVLNASPMKNFVCSPLSLDAMLNMIALGSKGQTLDQLLNFVGVNSIKDLRSKSSGIMNVASNRKLSSENDDDGGGGEPDLSFVNAIWVDQFFTLNPSYEELVRRIFSAEARAVDFRNKAEQITKEVNSWVSTETKGLIQQILPPGSLSSDTSLVLANALYFKGNWAQKFSKKLTRDRPFYLSNGDTISVPFMDTDHVGYKYGSFHGYKVLMNPYLDAPTSNRQFSMYFFLPDKKLGLPNMAQRFFSQLGFFNRDFDLEEEYELFDLGIPKFRFSYMFEGSEVLKELGLTLPFEAVGELTGIVESPLGDQLCLSRVFHKSFVEIDEEGTEAAASTIADMECGCSFEGSPPPVPTFVADRPFMFMIREEVSRAVFFVGAVLNPLLSE